MKNKLENLKRNLLAQKSISIAFSGGVDSTFLAKIAYDVLGDNATAYTVNSIVMPSLELYDAKLLAKNIGINHVIIDVNLSVLPEFYQNEPNRCYHCKKHIMGQILQKCTSPLAEASNTDDSLDYRPGSKAIAELNILSPLKQANLNKEEIRLLSKELNLKTHNKPSYACLASRIPYGDEITPQKLSMVEHAEDFLHSLGFLQCRVRCHGNIARIEVLNPEKLLESTLCKAINTKLLSLGFNYVCADLSGFRSGSMNEVLQN